MKGRYPTVTCLLTTPEFKPGDKPPKDYLDWHAWADVQRKAGIKQRQCYGCGKWITPQQFEDHLKHATHLNCQRCEGKGSVVYRTVGHKHFMRPCQGTNP